MKRTLTLILALAVTLSLAGCHGAHSGGEAGHHHEAEMHEHEGEGHEHEHEHEAKEHGHDGEIVISPERQQALGIMVSPATEERFAGIIRTSGMILPAPGDEISISATSSGVFHFNGSTPAAGTGIAKGKALGTINTTNVEGGDPVAKAKSAYEAAEKEYIRDTKLLEENIIAESHYDRSKAEYEQAKAAYEALISSGVSSAGLNVSAPVSGYIKAIYVSEGQYVSTGDAIATISRDRKLQLRADLSDKYYSKLKDIKDANFVTPDGRTYTMSGLGGRLLSASRSSIGHFLPVTFELNNTIDAAPGSYVDVYLKTAAGSESIVLPLSAVTESQGVYSVYIQHEEDAFLKRDVVIGDSDGINVQILAGLEPGEPVVTEGAIQVKLASVAAVPAGHTHNH